ncbi:hypothetical protein KIN20_017581 [Parelaphostrongylus tenuis]|uniref:Uncharacterized protein n=1 Tax=Parelaphostrongylus tenuis TaxID=148309 RepID=A0AAD5QNR3_PARTN|nr:hypothetical protein KIN20_017581 [Parelaphostrongylus tenuis]
MAAERSFNKLFLKGRRLVIRWGQPQAQKLGDEQRSINPVPSLPNPCPVPDDLAPSSSKRQRIDPLNIPLPPVPPSFAPPAKLVVPPTRPPAAVASSASSARDGSGSTNRSGGIYYPSQDPQRLGAKGDVIED